MQHGYDDDEVTQQDVMSTTGCLFALVVIVVFVLSVAVYLIFT